jgi:hypothetical protein
MQDLYSTNPWQDSVPAAGAEFTGEVYKIELDGTIMASSAERAKLPESSRRFNR